MSVVNFFTRNAFNLITWVATVAVTTLGAFYVGGGQVKEVQMTMSQTRADVERLQKEAREEIAKQAIALEKSDAKHSASLERLLERFHNLETTVQVMMTNSADTREAVRDVREMVKEIQVELRKRH